MNIKIIRKQFKKIAPLSIKCLKCGKVIWGFDRFIKEHIKECKNGNTF